MSSWKLSPKIDSKTKATLKDYPPIVQQLLFIRGIKTKKKASEFLDKEYLFFHNPEKIYGIKKAAEIILNAIKEKKKIVIHGDFDVDGICSTTILWDFLYRQLKADCLPYVPSRFEEGYGMSDKSLTKIQDMGGEIVITVDCGIKDDELIKKWKKKGLEFIVTDHHELKKDITNAKSGKNVSKTILPDAALAIVHPRHPKGKYPFKELSGATVVWKLVQVIAKVSAIDFDPDIYLDLVALSAICDVMPLVDENRSIVKAGLETMRKTKRVGLRRLIFDTGFEPTDIEAYHLGFIIGPRLNAAGRLDHAIDAIRLLSTKSLSKARELSEKLNSLNQKRQSIQKKIYDEALSQIEELGFESNLYFVWGEDWEEGVIGIVAGKISETYNRPVLIATRKKEVYTGSARSIETFNIIDAINSQSDLLERFGGHPLAAGFMVSEESIEQFRDNLLEIADRDLGDKDIEKKQKADCEVTIGDLDWKLFEWIQKFAPFGFENPEPRLILKDVELSSKKLVGQDKSHLSLAVLNKDTGEYMNGIGFGLGEKIGDLNNVKNPTCSLLFTLESNEWNGRTSLQMNLKDITP